MSKIDKTPQESPPKVRQDKEGKVWLLDAYGNKKKRICGAQRKDMPKGYLCTAPPGKGTDHPGYGFCIEHQAAIAKSTKRPWKPINADDQPKEGSLMAHIDYADYIEESEMANIDSDIKMLYGLQSYLMERNVNKEGKQYFSNSDLELMMKITDKIIRFKETRHKLNREVRLDVTTVKSFVEEIFKIIQGSVNHNISRRIMTQILDEVIYPFKEQGRIVGHDEEITQETQKLVDTVKKQVDEFEDAEVEDQEFPNAP